MDNREYKRVDTGAKGAFTIFDEEQFVLEFTGNIVDISEGGMKIIVADEDVNNVRSHLKKNCQLNFQAFDTCKLFGDDVSKIFGGTLQAVRKEDRDGFLAIGCRIIRPNDPLKQYIDDIKANDFLNKIRDSHEADWMEI